MITCHSVFNVWPKTTLLLPVWPRDAKKLDIPGRGFELEAEGLFERLLQ